MEEKIKIYIRSRNKVYICFNNEIYFFENQELEMALESFFEENNIGKNLKLAVILHYSYFLFDNFNGNVEESSKKENSVEDSGKKSIKFEDISGILKKKINFVKRKMVINHFEKQFLDIYLDKREIFKIKNCLKKYSAVVSELKVDFETVYSYFKDKNFEASQREKFENENNIFKNEENFQDVNGNIEEIQEIEIFKNEDAKKNQEMEVFENKAVNRDFAEIEEIDINENNNLENENDKIEILQLGEENSLRILIENEKIIEDVDDVENFDFGDMIVVGDGENDVKIIFSGAEFSDNVDFMKKMAVFDGESVKSIKVLDIAIAGIFIFAYFLIYNLIPLHKKIVENEIIQKEIKSLEKDYLKRKAEEIPNYSKELTTLREIDSGIKRREYYSVIKFLVENSKNGIDYTKINYEKAKWTVQGEMENFNNFERLENNILRSYPNSELGYLKDNDIATVFEYVIEPF